MARVPVQRIEKKLLILDIDETLLHASTFELDRDLDYHARTARTYVYKRPHVHDFLSFCGRHFRVAAWTSASEMFAREIFGSVFSLDYDLEFLWSSAMCTPVTAPSPSEEGIPLKDLNKVSALGYDLEQIVMVDDTPEKLKLHPHNLVQVRPFYGDPEDRELLALMAYLEKVSKLDSVYASDKPPWRKGAAAASQGELPR